MSRFADYLVSRTGTENQLKLNEFTELCNAFAVCALWSEIDDNGQPIEDSKGINDLSDCTVTKFAERCFELWVTAPVMFDAHAFIREKGIDQLGHSFWLSSNGHGTGFFDFEREYPHLAHWEGTCERLQAYSSTLGQIDLCIGDDGKVYA